MKSDEKVDSSGEPKRVDSALSEECGESLSAAEIEERHIQAMALKSDANEAYKANQYTQSIDKYDEAICLCHESFATDLAALYSNRAAARLMSDSELDKAVSDCTKAIELKPGYVRALWRRAQLYERTNKPHEAYEDAKQVLEIDKSHKEANLATLRLPDKIKARDEELKAEMMGGGGK